MKDIYKLELHESITIMQDDGVFPQIEIRRVPGGWIYSSGPYLNPVFVPYNTEFKK